MKQGKLPTPPRVDLSLQLIWWALRLPLGAGLILPAHVDPLQTLPLWV